MLKLGAEANIKEMEARRAEATITVQMTVYAKFFGIKLQKQSLSLETSDLRVAQAYANLWIKKTPLKRRDRMVIWIS